MNILAQLRSYFQGISQTLVVSAVLLGLFNSTIWAPSLEASPSAAFSSTSADAAPATPSASHPPDKAPHSSVDRKALAAEPTEAAAARAAVVPLKIDTRAARKSTDAPQPSLQAMSQKVSAQRPVFIENKGQFDARVRFQVRSGGKTLWLTDSGIVFDFVKGDPSAGESAPANSQLVQERTPSQPPANQKMERHVICQDFVSANHDVVIETNGVQEGTYNYFSGGDPAKWHTKVRAYSEIVYHNVWKGVDVRLYGNGSDLEQEFVVKPGAEISQVRVAYRGIEGLEVAKDGSLVINTAAGAMRETMPRIYQEKDGQHSAVQGQFELLSENSYTFSIAEHDSQYALVIDPTVLYSTYLGGSAGNDFGRTASEVATGVTVDAGGNAFVTGYTRSEDFPVTAGAFQTTYAGANEAGFISKFNATGSALVYSSYLDNTIYSPVGIAVDALGNAYVTGLTDHNGFPTTANAYSQDCNVSAFLSMLDPTGSTLLYSTCFGQNGSNYVNPFGIAVDSSGHAFVTGYTSGSIPTTPNAVQTSGFTGYPPGFVTGFDTNASGASSLYYSTYFGATSSDYDTLGVSGNAIAVDSFGKIYITGNTGDNLPVTPGAFQSSFISCNKCSHSFVAKLDPVAPVGQSLIYSTYLEGSQQDVGTGISVDGSGNAFVIGTTQSWDFPVTPGAFQAVPVWNYPLGNAYASFVAKMNAGGSRLGYASFIEPVCTTQSCVVEPINALGIAVDSLGDAYVTGWFRAYIINLPVTTDAFQSSYSKLGGDGQEGFLMKVRPDGSTLIYSSYLGGEADDVTTAVAVDQVGDAYVVGHTSSFTFPVTPVPTKNSFSLK